MLFLPVMLWILSPFSSAAFLPPLGYQGRMDGIRNDLESIMMHNQKCNDSSDCQENQYCFLSSYAAECRECQEEQMECQQDEECCPGKRCSWGRCKRENSVGDSGTRCDPMNDQCPSGFCCSMIETIPYPVCVPFPTEGQQCRSQASKFLQLLNLASDTDSEYCPCAEGLVCTNKGFNLISTCDTPDDVLDFTTYRGASLFQPVERRDDEMTYYDADLEPWSMQDDHLGVVELPRAAEESAREARNPFKVFSENMGENLEDESLHLEQHADVQDDPSQLEFQELKQIANQMEQYLGPDFY